MDTYSAAEEFDIVWVKKVPNAAWKMKLHITDGPLKGTIDTFTIRATALVSHTKFRAWCLRNIKTLPHLNRTYREIVEYITSAESSPTEIENRFIDKIVEYVEREGMFIGRVKELVETLYEAEFAPNRPFGGSILARAGQVLERLPKTLAERGVEVTRYRYPGSSSKDRAPLVVLTRCPPTDTPDTGTH